MLKDITLGQYFPGESFIHRMDPRMKILLTIVFIVMLFLAKGPFAYALVLAFLALCIITSGIRLRVVLKGLKPLLFVIALTGLLNMFYTPGEALWSFGFLQITREGVVTAVYMILRIAMLVTGTFMLTYTTSPIRLTDGIEGLLNPLKKIRLPVHELAMMMTIALRFIPTLIEETDKIMSAQKARGADFESGNVLRRAKALIPIIVPLFVSAFRRAGELATAMECRCYRGGEGRTRLHKLAYSRVDAEAVGIIAVFCAAVIVLSYVLW
ncbi:energy-coupling factor transporter transmembrane protein EcfT [Oscillospiraceae bacterium OttesenSCG-928-F05]|nr:energy-coupling factor transporter transmembrane protein EcfT [Oscillospiraceae bacterium OttesenSCG-928-F05]